MGDYIDTVLLNQRGAHFGGADLGKAIAKLYDETLDGLVYSSQSVWRAASGLVSVESSSSAVFKIILDGSEIGETPFTFPVTAQIEHKISFRSAAAQLERVVQAQGWGASFHLRALGSSDPRGIDHERTERNPNRLLATG